MMQGDEESFYLFWRRWELWQEKSLRSYSALPLPVQLFVSRNLAHLPFPSSFDNDAVQDKWPKVAQLVTESTVVALKQLPWQQLILDSGLVALKSWQQGLLSSWSVFPSLAKERQGAFLLFARQDSAAPFVLLNGRDHIALATASFSPWSEKLRALQTLATKLEKVLSFAVWQEEKKESYYLTSSVAQAGAGVSLYQFLQVPALSFMAQVDWLFVSAHYLPFGLRVCSSDKSLLQVVGESGSVAAEEVVSTMEAFAAKVEQMESNARAKLLKQDHWRLRDLLYRSLAVIRSALEMSFDEAVEHWRNIYLGVSLGLCQGMDSAQLALLPLRLSTPYLVYAIQRDLPSFVSDKIFVNKLNTGLDWSKQIRADWLRWQTRQLTVN